MESLTGGDRSAELLGIAWVSVLGSGLVGNIPFTAAMIPVVDQLQAGQGGGDDAYWWALAIGAYATLVAAGANVAAAGMAERAGKPIGFMVFLKARPACDAAVNDHRHAVRRDPRPVR